jgi:hypothetical protein
MQKARRHTDTSSALRPLVGAWFQGLLTPLLGVLFTFPLRYLFAIGLPVVFRLTRWCWQIQTEFHRLRPTQDTARYATHFDYGAVTRYGPTFQTVRLCTTSPLRSPTTPTGTPVGLASSAFARHYLRNHYLFYFPPPT